MTDRLREAAREQPVDQTQALGWCGVTLGWRVVIWDADESEWYDGDEAYPVESWLPLPNIKELRAALDAEPDPKIQNGSKVKIAEQIIRLMASHDNPANLLAFYLAESCREGWEEGMADGFEEYKPQPSSSGEERAREVMTRALGPQSLYANAEQWWHLETGIADALAAKDAEARREERERCAEAVCVVLDHEIGGVIFRDAVVAAIRALGDE